MLPPLVAIPKNTDAKRALRGCWTYWPSFQSGSLRIESVISLRSIQLRLDISVGWHAMGTATSM
jgi:hypothetical protein